MKQKHEKESELRYNLLTDDWVIIAPKRGKRPDNFGSSVCPFCKIESDAVLIYSNGKRKEDLKNWTTVVVPNKYPILAPNFQKKESSNEGDFCKKISSPGFHELVISKDHDLSIALLPIKKIEEIITCYQDRINEYKKHDFVKQVIVFHNHGKEAGASQPHPHSQILTTPIIDKEFRIILKNFKDYFVRNKECLQCKVNKLEKKEKERIVFENNDFIAYVPFAPKLLYQVVIAPKKHNPRFEEITDSQKKGLTEAFKFVLSKIYKKLDNKAYNFYLHTAPLDKKDYSYFHWYWTISPRTQYIAGFELGANMEISTIFPEDQAKFLRK